MKSEISSDLSSSEVTVMTFAITGVSQRNHDT